MRSSCASDVLDCRVLNVCPCSLLVLDTDTYRAVRVNTCQARRFSVGDCLRCYFNGEMSDDTPQEIDATKICRVCDR